MILGSVPYLNARPLCFGLDPAYDVPSRLATQLHEGKYDAALVPVAECLQHSGYTLVDGIGITGTGPVHSVILQHNVPLDQVKTIAPDPDSRTSNLLMRALVSLRGKSDSVTFTQPGAVADARILIGDPAIQWRTAHQDQPVLDLGEAWQHATGLPFVFAVWAIRPGVDALPIANHLRKAAVAGLAAREQIAASPLELEYITRYIRYEIGAPQKEGLGRFANLLVDLGEIPAPPVLNWI